MKNKLNKKPVPAVRSTANFRNSLFSFAKVLTLFTGLTYVILSIPQIHHKFIREVIGDRVVMLANHNPEISKTYGGGTGFHVKTPSGDTVIVSNRHVCASSVGDYMWVSIRGATGYRKLKILERFSHADLCILEPIEGVEGLTVGSRPGLGDNLWAVGHPHLQPKTVTSGEMVGYSNFDIVSGVVGVNGYTKEECKNSNERLIQVSAKAINSPASTERLRDKDLPNMFPLLGQKIDLEGFSPVPEQQMVSVCIDHNVAMITTVDIYRGNSGSPVLNNFGQVVGVIFAMREDGHWGQAISLSDLKALLSKY